jgi:hypothetical protein
VAAVQTDLGTDTEYNLVLVIAMMAIG